MEVIDHDKVCSCFRQSRPRGWLLALPANIWLGWKCLTVKTP